MIIEKTIDLYGNLVVRKYGTDKFGDEWCYQKDTFNADGARHGQRKVWDWDSGRIKEMSHFYKGKRHGTFARSCYNFLHAEPNNYKINILLV